MSVYTLLLAQARDRCTSRNPSLPEIDRASDPEAAFPEVGEGDRPGLQNRPEVSECCHRRSPGKTTKAAAGAEELWLLSPLPEESFNSVALVLNRRLVKRTWWVYLKILICVPSTLRESPSCPKISSWLAGYGERELKRRQFLWCFVVNSVKYFGLICDFFCKKLFIICCICT